MVIACYAGVGKSTFAEKYSAETIDLCSMPFKWILPGKLDGEFEDAKAAPYLLRNPAFPDNYMEAILVAEQKYKYVLIPTVCNVLERFVMKTILILKQMMFNGWKFFMTTNVALVRVPYKNLMTNRK